MSKVLCAAIATFTFTAASFGSAFVPGELYLLTLQQPNSPNAAIMQVGSDGSATTAVDGLSCMWNSSMVFADESTVYVSEAVNEPASYGQITAYKADGSSVRIVDGIPATNRWPNGTHPTGFVIDSDRTIYAATWNTPGASKVSNGSVTDFTGYYHSLWWGTDAALSPLGELYMTAGLAGQVWPHVFRIDKETGAVHEELNGLTQTEGIAFDEAGNMFLGAYDTDSVLKVAAGSSTPTVLAHLDGASRIEVGPDGLLYAVGGVLSDQKPAGRGTEIWRIDPITGDKSRIASGLPPVLDIAFAPVPEPGTAAMFIAGVLGVVIRRRVW